MSNYRKGRRWEYVARDELLREGFKVVRASGSKGVVDLIAWNDSGFKLIQVKSSKTKRLFKVEKLLLEALPAPNNASLELWVRKPRNGVWVKRVLALPEKVCGMVSNG